MPNSWTLWLYVFTLLHWTPLVTLPPTCNAVKVPRKCVHVTATVVSPTNKKKISQPSEIYGPDSAYKDESGSEIRVAPASIVSEIRRRETTSRHGGEKRRRFRTIRDRETRTAEKDTPQLTTPTKSSLPTPPETPSQRLQDLRARENRLEKPAVLATSSGVERDSRGGTTCPVIRWAWYIFIPT